MPNRPPRPCGQPGCPALVRSGRCAKHRRARPKDARPGFRRRGYGHGWEEIRAVVLRRDPTCKQCGRAASKVAAHIRSKRQGGSDQVTNLRGLCLSCHARETAALDGGFGNRVRR
jgi:5-methylcytosine-specific restriction protein A